MLRERSVPRVRTATYAAGSLSPKLRIEFANYAASFTSAADGAIVSFPLYLTPLRI